MTFISLNSNGAIPYNNQMFNFYVGQEFVDTELILSNGKIKSHSIVLAAGSKKLYNMLISQTEIQKTLILDQFSKETMRIILEYIYRGTVMYGSQYDEDINIAITFLELGIKTEPTDECKVETSEGEIDDSVIEIKREDTLLEISDSEPEASNVEHDSSLEKTNIEQSRQPEVSTVCILPLDYEHDSSLEKNNIEQSKQREIFTPSPSSVFNRSYDFLIDCNERRLSFEDLSSPKQSCLPLQPEREEKSPTDSGTSPKRRKKEDKLKNPFSEYIAKKSQETSPVTLQRLSETHQNNRCTSESPSEKLTNKKPDKNIWMNKKENPNHFDNNFCLVCEQAKKKLKSHIQNDHKKTFRHVHFTCKKCSLGFFFRIFYEYHMEFCKKKR